MVESARSLSPVALLASVQSAQDSTVPGSLVIAAVIAVAITVAVFLIGRFIEANRVDNMPLPQEGEQ